MKEENVSLKKHNTYGIGGTAKYLYHPKDCDDLLNILNELKEKDIPYYILGSGSNVILPDEDYNGAIIKLDLINDFSVNDNIIYASSGILLTTFVNKMLDNEYTNYTSLFGIPGTLGGALVGNAGCYGKEIFDDLISIKVLDNNEIKVIPKEMLDYSYRYTEFKKDNRIILGATFKGVKGDVSSAKDQIKTNLEKRRSSQPLEFKNAGSVFKNPDGLFAAKLIEDLSLKGYRVNDAMISEKHANFIINLANASSNDIIKLINEVKIKVKEKYNVDLELEQIIVKW